MTTHGTLYHPRWRCRKETARSAGARDVAHHSASLAAGRSLTRHDVPGPGLWRRGRHAATGHFSRFAGTGYWSGHDLTRFTDDPRTLVSLPRVFQLWGRRE